MTEFLYKEEVYKIKGAVFEVYKEVAEENSLQEAVMEGWSRAKNPVPNPEIMNWTELAETLASE